MDSTETTLRRVEVAEKIFQRISEKWCLSHAEQQQLLGQAVGCAPMPWALSPSDAELEEMMIRTSHLMNIYGALHSLFSDDAQADGWVRRPNQASPFQGKSALERMCQGGLDDLKVVHDYLAAHCG